jgi:hypothetical protein
MPKFDLSTILGFTLAVFGVAQQFFPNQTWLGPVAAGLTAIVLQEEKAVPPLVPPTKPLT